MRRNKKTRLEEIQPREIARRRPRFNCAARLGRRPGETLACGN